MLKAYNPKSAANDDVMRPSSSTGERPHGAFASTQLMVPIRSIGPSQRPRIIEHLVRLNSDDRYLRFGYAATDEQIANYVAHIDFERDDVFGIYNRKLELIATAHLALADRDGFESCAEFGVSVAHRARGRGYGTRLFERAVMHARNEGRQLLFIQALSENATMLSIARRAGAVVERFGADSEAYLRLPRASFDSRLSEAVYQGFAETDYRLKEQAKRFHDMVFALRRAEPGGRVL
ncbi:MAG: GNAT family N-acetyltransferase [Burkholderiales bacterium]